MLPFLRISESSQPISIAYILHRSAQVARGKLFFQAFAAERERERSLSKVCRIRSSP